MEHTLTPRVKICCIKSVEEAWAAVRFGASAIGLVSDMPSGPGVISETLIATITRVVPPGVDTFLLTSKQDATEIIEQHRRVRTKSIQICDRLLRGTHRELRESLPGVGLVQVIHVTGEEAIDEAAAVALHVNAILLDSGNPTLDVKELGGTGRTHNWEISRKIRMSIPVPVYLAGGLTPGNVGEAVRQVGPFGLDVCSGVRTEGELDPSKLALFFDTIHSMTKSEMLYSRTRN